MPAWAAELERPHRYKVLHGGRGSGKSWAIARSLLLGCLETPHRHLCTREVQKSIKESVHRLLSDQIQAMGLGWFFEILETEIRGKNGSVFSFAGLLNHTITSIKSYEGYDRCWVEEAQTVSQKSWDILIPTIRAPGSEIWVSFNPLLDSDPVWVMFVEGKRPDAWVRQVNWSDNPWFPQELELERAHCKVAQPDAYDNIWEGICRPTVEGAIYANEVAQALADERIRPVPYDPRLKVHAIWDLGWNDQTTIVMAQRDPMAIRVIDYLEDSHKTLDWYVAELKKRNYNWGMDFVPHDAAAKDFKTGRSTLEILRAMGRKPKLTPQVGVENGIRAARQTLPRCYFDKVRTGRLIECLKRYKRAVPQTTGEPGAPVHDEYSHGADAFRYMSVVAEQLTNEDDRPAPVVGYGVLDATCGY